jgi:hypothetical protein
LAARAEPPRFDAWVGLDLARALPDPGAWIAAMRPFAAPAGRFVWAEANPARSQGLSEYLAPARIGAELSEKIIAVESEWRRRLPASPLEAARAGAAAAAPGATATVVARDISALRHFTPSQIRAWFPDAATRPNSLLAALSAALTPPEKGQIEGALADVFQGAGAEWRQGYDFLVLAFP